MNNQSPATAEQIREFVIAGHGDLSKVQAMLAKNPELLNASHEWSENDTETAVQAAAHVGNAAIAEYLLAQGAPLEICTAAMLGRIETVAAMLDTAPHLIQAAGAHHIPLLTHAALSGGVELVQMLYQRGARNGVSAALNSAVSRHDTPMVRWLLQEANPDLHWENFQGKTAQDIATANAFTDIVELLHEYAAQ